MKRLLEAVKQIISAPFPLEYSPYMKTLQLCIDAKAEKEGLLIHHHLIANGFSLNPHLGTKLIIFYAKLHNMLAARKVFDRMPDRSVVSWTALLSGYSQNGHLKEALKVFSSMQRVGIKPNQFTYGSVLRACSSMRCLNIGKQIQGCIQKGRFLENLFVQSALVDLHSKCGKMEDACCIFDTMSERDLVSWNAMISGYATQMFTVESFQMYRTMLRTGLLPDCFTIASVLKAAASGTDIINVSQVHGFIIHLGYGSWNDLTGSLVNAYAKCGGIKIADYLYKNLPKKDLISCTALISGYAREANCKRDALLLFNEIHRMFPVLDDAILCSMIHICASIASVDLGRQVHALALKSLPRFDVVMGNSLLDMYAKSGWIEEANLAFDEIQERNVISWTSLIAGYGKHGYGQEAMALYRKMEHDGLKPNDVTFLCLLFSCSHSGLIGEGLGCFNTMVRKYNIIPKAEHYNCMVDLFARGGQLEEAYNVVCKMDFKPNASLWGAFLGACATHNNVSLGEIAARHLYNMEPENSASYIALAGIYAGAGMWDCANDVKKLMEHKDIKKVTGYSLLQSTNRIGSTMLRN